MTYTGRVVQTCVIVAVPGHPQNQLISSNSHVKVLLYTFKIIHTLIKHQRILISWKKPRYFAGALLLQGGSGTNPLLFRYKQNSPKQYMVLEFDCAHHTTSRKLHQQFQQLSCSHSSDCQYKRETTQNQQQPATNFDFTYISIFPSNSGFSAYTVM